MGTAVFLDLASTLRGVKRPSHWSVSTTNGAGSLQRQTSERSRRGETRKKSRSARRREPRALRRRYNWSTSPQNQRLRTPTR